MTQSGAHFSEDRKYRYSLWRTWNTSLDKIMFIGLNPSTADETQNDPTIRREINYVKAWGYGGLIKCNLFAYCATDPKILGTVVDPVGPENDYQLIALAKQVPLIVAAWGDGGIFMHRGRSVVNMIPNLRCFKKNKSGQPAHPLYLRKDLKPQIY